LRRLIAKRSARWEERAFVAEGTNLFDAAESVGLGVESVFIAAEGLSDVRVRDLRERAFEAGCRIFELAPGVMVKVSGTVTPQPVVSIMKMVDVGVDNLEGGKLVVVCADVRDPGNAGTIVRSASASGVDAVVFAGSSVDPYNPKTVRASAGALFFLPLVVEPDLLKVMTKLREMGYRRLGAVVAGGVDYLSVEWGVPTALVLGNEASGLPAEIDHEVDARIEIPMTGPTESLNVGVASAVICFEAFRQRRLSGDVEVASGKPSPELLTGDRWAT
jgi:TrmH family RNA methyltransferase